MKRILFSVLFILCFCRISSAIDISGDVWGEWSADNNPYKVIGDLRVPPGSTLVIGPGCLVEFQGHYKFVIDTTSSFLALGTETDSITFTAIDTVSSSPDTTAGWLGLRFFSAGNDCAISYCLIEWGNMFRDELEPFNNGGGIYCRYSNLTITHCLISKNTVWEGYGGGIYCIHSNVDIIESKIVSNHAGFGGSGVYACSSGVDIVGCFFEDNRTWYALGGEVGGAITCHHSTVELVGNKIVNNFCGMISGGVYIAGCNVTIHNNQISENIAMDVGGGLMVLGSTGVISYNVISSNEGWYGVGGLSFTNNGQFIIFNNTIYDNYAGLYGAGGAFIILNEDDSLYNCIIRGNRSDYNDPNIRYWSNDSSLISYSNIEGGWPGEGNIDADPLFCDPEESNFYLAENSPCVGAGFNGANIGAFGIGCDSVGIFDEPYFVPEAFSLSQNYPNPFNASTAIRFDLPKTSDVTIDIYDMLGRKIETLYDGIQPAGAHSVIWQANGFSSGIYFYKLTAGDYSQTQRMMLLK